jgi:hypothetical protein
MKNSYTQQANELYKNKAWNSLNTFIWNCADLAPKGQLVISKKVANKLTLGSIVAISCKHRLALDHIPEYKPTDMRAIVIDWMKDFKLDREYKKPKTDMLFTVFNQMRSYGCAGYAISLLEALGMTKEEFIKGYRDHKLVWRDIFGIASGFKFRPTDQDIRKMYNKYRDHNLLLLTSKHLDSELRCLFAEHTPLDTAYSQKSYFQKHIGKFSNNALLYALLKFRKDFSDRYGNNNSLVTEIVYRLAKAKQKGLYEVVKHLYGNTFWAESLIQHNHDLSLLKDGELDVILSCLPEDKKYDYICNYYDLKPEQIESWYIK